MPQGQGTGTDPELPQDINTDVAHPARVYDYWLGGKDNFPADRALAEMMIQAIPNMRGLAAANRAFLRRAVRHLAGEAGIRQFLDIGTGIPTSPNLHEVVQEVKPDARIVYTDNDPIVLAHARALMSRTGQGKTTYVDADLRDPDTILGSREFRETLDPDRPIGLMLIAVVHFIEDDDEALDVVRRIVDVLPSGSYVAATIATDEYAPELLAEVRRAYREHGETLKFRDHGTALRFFDGLEIVEPGLVQMHKWRPDDLASLQVPEADIAMYAAIARKP
jgi:S-adenosyl methyltransferase